jgi:hypothetical protein
LRYENRTGQAHAHHYLAVVQIRHGELADASALGVRVW